MCKNLHKRAVETADIEPNYGSIWVNFGPLRHNKAGVVSRETLIICHGAVLILGRLEAR